MLLFELIQIALGQEKQLSHSPSIEEWESVYHEAIKQAVVGIAFEGMKKLPRNQWPTKAILLQWFGINEQVRKQNILLNQRTVEITELFEKAGFNTRILKGQGNARMYYNPYCRMPGDIDILVNASRKSINTFIRGKFPKAYEQEHHIDFPIFDDVEVEVHYTPGVLLNPFRDIKYQRWCKAQNETVLVLLEGTGTFSVPSTQFNAIFQMAHIMDHFFVEGIGLRHFVDYYFVIKKCYTEKIRTDEICHLFNVFGLTAFAKGVMWVEKECLGIDDSLLLIETDSKKGSVILNEMLNGGNFGHYDNRYKNRRYGYIARGIEDTKRLFKLMTVFPQESLWKIYRKIANQRWRWRRIIV